ncbi:hypothetical protein BC834DRAFT_296236 [Gloeopeniophorella convolvens]|nr:hypothetical protein BC834DRAFT_296236 [Gloeopeniophorella convolvens]
MSVAQCLPGWEWTWNALGQSPCQVASILIGLCIGSPTVAGPLAVGTTYLPPPYASLCWCNSILYSLLSACSSCQEQGVVSWNTWARNCTWTAGSGIIPGLVIVEETVIPGWAFADIAIIWNAWEALEIVQLLSDAADDHWQPGAPPAETSAPASTLDPAPGGWTSYNGDAGGSEDPPGSGALSSQAAAPPGTWGGTGGLPPSPSPPAVQSTVGSVTSTTSTGSPGTAGPSPVLGPGPAVPPTSSSSLGTDPAAAPPPLATSASVSATTLGLALQPTSDSSSGVISSSSASASGAATSGTGAASTGQAGPSSIPRSVVLGAVLGTVAAVVLLVPLWILMRRGKTARARERSYAYLPSPPPALALGDAAAPRASRALSLFRGTRGRSWL